MKRSWIIVLAFVFLYSAVPAFSGPRKPVPSKLCLDFDSYSDTLRLFLESKGKIAGVEHFEVTGTHYAYRILPVTGTAHRAGARNQRVIFVALNGAAAETPGDSVTIQHADVHFRYHLKKKDGRRELLLLRGLNLYRDRQHHESRLFESPLSDIS